MPYDTYTDTTGTIWLRWISDNTTTASTTTSDYVWHNWNTTSTSTSVTYNVNRVYTPPVETEEQRRLRREAVKRAEKQRAELEAAEARAKELLLSMLTEEQRHHLHREGRFKVCGNKGGEYEITIGYAGNIRRGRHRYCGHLSDGRIPTYDHMLAQKLMIETDEEAFLALANRS